MWISVPNIRIKPDKKKERQLSRAHDNSTEFYFYFFSLPYNKEEIFKIHIRLIQTFMKTN